MIEISEACLKLMVSLSHTPTPLPTTMPEMIKVSLTIQW